MRSKHTACLLLAQSSSIPRDTISELGWKVPPNKPKKKKSTPIHQIQFNQTNSSSMTRASPLVLLFFFFFACVRVCSDTGGKPPRTERSNSKSHKTKALPHHKASAAAEDLTFSQTLSLSPSKKYIHTYICSTSSSIVCHSVVREEPGLVKAKALQAKEPEPEPGCCL